MIRVRSVLVGIAVAFVTPFWVRSGRLERLLGRGDETAAPTHTVGAAIEASHTALRHLARLRGPWRNTCLYRSVAECLVLRHAGVSARVVLGVRRGDGAGNVLAHAWVESHGEVAAEGDGYSRLRSPEVVRA
jgi:hypothetical protein